MFVTPSLSIHLLLSRALFSFTDTATTAIYTLSLHDALPISTSSGKMTASELEPNVTSVSTAVPHTMLRSEEHTSELQSRGHLVCRLLLEKKKKMSIYRHNLNAPALILSSCSVIGGNLNVSAT